MTCDVCQGNDTVLHATANGGMLLHLCPVCANGLPDVAPVIGHTAECPACALLGKCCQTAQGGR